ncbi:hypothetical protein N7487_000320 [Penicillium crustosum]|nr:hypothetical protein N7487_000320 [Penicillium crustosum]
MSFIVEKRMPR